jgi:hypothetical protein
MMKALCDWKMIGRGLALLSVMTVLGVMAAEQQINQLTERQTFVQSFNVVRKSDGTYLTYLLGDSYRVARSYNVGVISNSDKAVYLGVGSTVYIVPYIYSFPVQEYFDELYQLSYSWKPNLYKVKRWLDRSRQSVMAAVKQFDRQLR